MKWDAIVLAALLAVAIRAQDDRCFLNGGGSAQTFFVSENTTVGSVIGVLEIGGEAGSSGDIVLRFHGNETRIAIQENSKNLTLLQPLDKEGIDGPTHIATSLTCERLGNHNEPRLQIPVNIRVTDANDNAPVFQNAPYSLSISESTAIGSVLLQRIQALDGDQAGAYSTVEYSVLPGPNSDVLGFVSSLEGTLVLRKSVDYESVKQLNISIRAQDQGQPALYSDTFISIDIIDADDQNPVFSQSRYWTHLPQPALQGSVLEMRPEQMKAVDQDAGINSSIQYSWNGGGAGYDDFELDADDGSVRLRRHLQDNELVQPVTLVVKAFQVDNGDRYALTTLTISRSWSFSPTVQFLRRRYDVIVAEDVAVHTTLLALAINKPAHPKVRFVVEEAVQDRFSVDSTGELKLEAALDYETQTSHKFFVWVTDGVSNDTAVVNVTVSNVNEWAPHFDRDGYTFSVNHSGGIPAGIQIGRLRVADKDVSDRISLQLKPTPPARAFSINDDGEIVVSDVAELNTTSVSLTVVARDNGNPPRQASVAVEVHFRPDALSASGDISVSTSGSSSVLLIVLAILLGVLSLIISALAVYVCQNKRKKEQPMMTLIRPKVTSMYHNGDMSCDDAGDAPRFPVTATLRRVPINPLARRPNGNLRKIVPIRSPQSPAVPTPLPPPLPAASSAASSSSSSSSSAVRTTTSPTSLMSLPHRVTVKKLSWEDDFNVFF